MIEFLRNKYIIIFEIIVLILSIIWFWNSREIEPIITFIGSISFLIASLGKLRNKNKNEVIERPDQKILHQNFLYDYIPGEVGISKIIEDFGQPRKITLETLDSENLCNEIIEYYVYEYKFSNAIVLFSTDTELGNIIAITLLPYCDEKYPIICRYSFVENEENMDIAEFKKSIITHMRNFENKMYSNWCYSAITSRYADYRPIMYLYFTYINYNYFEEADDLYLEKIESICVSTSSEIHPIIHFDKVLFS
ncbi:hypothetical protein [Flavobacterium sp. TSSA_36]|uniref:hypothetical protein n=1 Tax=Flavobacterium sp. TSSA_36 TaxID=3447669 RepID=UPI003F2C3E59